jgi:quercetin dioxygenase-like cupin family protein
MQGGDVLVVAGSGWILADGSVHDLRQWDVLRVAPEVVRAFEAGPDGLELIAIAGPKPAVKPSMGVVS